MNNNIKYGSFTIIYNINFNSIKSSIYNLFYTDSKYIHSLDHSLIKDIIINFDDDYTIKCSDIVLNNILRCNIYNKNINPFTPHYIYYNSFTNVTVYNMFLEEKIRLLFNNQNKFKNALSPLLLTNKHKYENSIYNCIYSDEKNKDHLTFGLTKINETNKYIFAYDESVFDKDAVLSIIHFIFEKNNKN